VASCLWSQGWQIRDLKSVPYESHPQIKPEREGLFPAGQSRSLTSAVSTLRRSGLNAVRLSVRRKYCTATLVMVVLCSLPFESPVRLTWRIHASLWLPGRLFRLPMSFFRRLESLIGMFHCLLGMLVSGLVILFPVMRGGGTVRVCGEFVELGGSLVRVIWHCFFPSSA
jgi:hypothetical protein